MKRLRALVDPDSETKRISTNGGMLFYGEVPPGAADDDDDGPTARLLYLAGGLR